MCHPSLALVPLVSVVWTFINKDKKIVKASQPFFLYLICLGCFISSCTIIPLMIDDREVDDPSASCMSFPWLYGIGFALTFSSLFAKIIRVKMLFLNKKITKKKVGIKEVMPIVLACIGVEALLLLIWTLVSPLSYVRDCDEYDIFGQCMSSFGSCTNTDNGAYKTVFIPLIAVIHVSVLLYSCVLCYQTRNVSTEFAEGRWISMAMFSNLQIMVLGAPLIALVANGNPSVSFIVRAGIIWMNDGSVVLMTFAPKMYALYIGDAKAKSTAMTIGTGATGLATNRANTTSNSTGDSPALQEKDDIISRLEKKIEELEASPKWADETTMIQDIKAPGGIKMSVP